MYEFAVDIVQTLLLLLIAWTQIALARAVYSVFIAIDDFRLLFTYAAKGRIDEVRLPDQGEVALGTDRGR